MTIIDEPITKPPFEIDRDEVADWAMSKLAHARQQQNAIKTAKQQQIDAITRAADRQHAPHERTASFFTELLTRYRWRRLQTDFGDSLHDLTDAKADKAWSGLPNKTLPLASGEIVAKAAAGGYEVTDDGDLLAWALGEDLALQLPEWVKLGVLKSQFPADWKPGPAQDDGLRKVINADGEIIPGVMWRPKHVTVKVVPDLTHERPAFLPPPDGIDPDFDGSTETELQEDR